MRFSMIALKWSRVGESDTVDVFGVNRPELAMKLSCREQCEYKVLRIAYWMFGKLSASVQLHGDNLSVSNWNSEGDNAYMQIKLFFVLPSVQIENKLPSFKLV